MRPHSKVISKISIIGLMLILFVIFIAVVVLGVFKGSVDLPLSDVCNTLFYNFFHAIGIDLNGYEDWNSGVVYDIVWNGRAPRVFLAATVGIMLALAGIVMQATVQNPLADPYILGMSSGASLGATISIAMGITSIGGAYLGNNSIAFFAFIGSMISAIAVLLLSSAGGRTTSVKLVLSGAIISSLASAFSSLFVVLFSSAEEMETLTYWLMGSFAKADWDILPLPIIVMIIGLLFFITQIRNLNTMLMGDESSITLGVDLSKKRKMYVIVISLLTAVSVCYCGIIGFVGLIIPHIVRAIVGNNHWRLIPVGCICGAIFLVAADILSRTIMDVGELPIGIITALCGAPVFAYIMIKKTYAFM